MQRLDRSLPTKSLGVLCSLLLCSFSFTFRLLAQNGITAVEGTSIGTTSTTDSLWADNTDWRWKVGVHTYGPFDLAFWPCGGTQGGLIYATSTAQFAYQSSATDIEIYWRDLELAFGDTGYCQLDSGTPPTYCVSGISRGGQIADVYRQATFFQAVGKGYGSPCGGSQTQATGTCAYATMIKTAHGQH